MASNASSPGNPSPGQVRPSHIAQVTGDWCRAAMVMAAWGIALAVTATAVYLTIRALLQLIVVSQRALGV